MTINPLKDKTNKGERSVGDDLTKGGQNSWEKDDGFDAEPKKKSDNKGIDKGFWNKRSDGPGLSFQPGQGPKAEDGFSEDYAKKGNGGFSVKEGFLKPGGLAENDAWPDEDYFYDCGKDGKFGN